MNTFQKYLLGLTFLLCTVQPVFAQSVTFSVLPGTNLDMDKCQPIIDQYIVDGKMPSAAESDGNLASQVDSLQSTLDTKNQAATDAFLAKSKIDQEVQDKKKKVDELDQCSSDLSAQTASGYPSSCLTSPQYQQGLKDEYLAASAAQVQYDKALDQAMSEVSEATNAFTTANSAAEKANLRTNLLGCAIKTGRISLSMIPYFITYIINFALGFVGLIALLFVVIGGYHYVLGGLGEDKDKGKNTIKNALIGMAVALLSWSAVNVIIQILTS